MQPGPKPCRPGRDVVVAADDYDARSEGGEGRPHKAGGAGGGRVLIVAFKTYARGVGAARGRGSLDAAVASAGGIQDFEFEALARELGEQKVLIVNRVVVDDGGVQHADLAARAAIRRSAYFSRVNPAAVFRAAADMFASNAGSARKRSRAAAMAPGSRMGTMKPSRPSRTTEPEFGVAITGKPAASAS